jgi:catechol 2,3-dioxygenase-like lactoylglutathione lyase family enzyme
MDYAGVDHIGIAVGSIENALAFWEKALESAARASRRFRNRR